MMLWKLLDRWWEYYWNSFKCSRCKKRYDDRWQTEKGVRQYCKMVVERIYQKLRKRPWNYLLALNVNKSTRLIWGTRMGNAEYVMR
ncbi:MAG: hypothetical protein I3274_02450 [Candidatus Moeniiplasma glomeromycotorum]|nr:hypothetical protein [Candidatus Moeniiplasma glomeromycotorum]